MGKEILFTEQQIEQLKEKGLIIESNNNAKEILKHFSSFDVIEVYEKLFMKDGRFKENITIEKIFQFYHYDRSIQNILFKYTVYIERVFKNKMASVISENLGVRKEEYLNIKNYILRNDSGEIIRNVIEEINELSGANPKKFDMMELNYFKDDKNVYYFSNKEKMMIKVENVDTESFEIMNDDYAKDKNNTYYKGKVFKEADMKTLDKHYDENNNGYKIKDKKKVYKTKK